VLLGLAACEDVTVGELLAAPTVVEDREGDLEGVGDLEGDLEAVPLRVRERLGLWLGEEPELGVEVRVERGEGVPLELTDFDGVTVGVTETAPPVVEDREGDLERVGDLEGDLEVVPLRVRERLGLWLREEPELSEAVRVESGEGVPLGLPDFEGVTVGVAVLEPPTVRVRDGDTVGVGVAPPTGGDLEGVPEMVAERVRLGEEPPLMVRVTVTGALGEGLPAPPAEGDLEGVPDREGDLEGVADLERVALGEGVPAPPALRVRDGDTVGVGVVPPAPGDLEGELEGVPLREPDREGVPLREPERVGVPLRELEREEDCDTVADGVLLGVEPKELLAVPLRV
jgi:hypothetical protein